MSDELTLRNAAEKLDVMAIEQMEDGQIKAATDSITLAIALENRQRQKDSADFKTEPHSDNPEFNRSRA